MTMTGYTSKIKVLVIDDSAMIRQLLSAILNEAPDIEVVGTANDPYAARDAIKRLNPDVLTLDVEMPKMDGLTFLENLMRLRPMPVIMVSTLTERGADVTLQALELGAIDFVTKPKTDVQRGLSAYAEDLVNKVRAAASARVWSRGSAAPIKRERTGLLYTTDRILALGASTGGVEALREVLLEMPADAPATVVTQHIPKNFSESFVARIDSLAAVTIKHAEPGEQLLAGHVYFPPGDHHLQVKRSGAKYVAYCDPSGPVNHHRPSVDVLFHSLAEAAGPNTCAALLTGMGADGARGLLAIREAGGYTVAQDQASSVVWGMPRAAVELGAAIDVMPLGKVAHALLQAASAARATARK